MFSLILIPSTKTDPFFGFKKPIIKFRQVVFPDPLFPFIPKIVFFLILKLTFFNTLLEFPYSKNTLLKFISFLNRKLLSLFKIIFQNFETSSNN